jgi:predicted transposase YbfD/YdcC
MTTAPLSLLECLAQVPDPRSRKGRRHPLSAILSLAVLAMLTGAKGYEAIAQFGRDKGFPLAWALGFTRGKTPCKATLCVLFRRIDVTAFEAALSRWVASRLLGAGADVIAIDGKTARGSKDGETPGHHLVAAYAPQVRAVLAQIRVDAKTNEHKAALELLGVLPVKGKVITGDAAFCQRDLAAVIVDAGGDYILWVKKNQPGLEVDIGAGLAFEAEKRRQAAAFFPRAGPRAAARLGGQQRGQGARALRETDDPVDDEPDEAPAVEGFEAGLRVDP